MTTFRLSATALLLCLVSLSCKNEKKEAVTETEAPAPEYLYAQHIDSTAFIQDSDSIPLKLYTLKNKNGIEVTFTNWGQRLVSLYTPDKNGEFDDIVLGFPTLDGYKNANEVYIGSTIGRYGNRIAKGKFSIGDEEYTLATNNGENHLHGGGPAAFNKVPWNAEQINDSEVVFTRLSPDGEEGYPGNLEVRVEYTLTDDNELVIKYFATTDKTTPVNLTHHSFFNLTGEGSGESVNGNLLTINADKFTPVDSGLIPTGELRSVEGTPFDFREAKAIGQDVEADNEQLAMGKGYDHNFVLNAEPKNDDGLTFAAKVVDPKSGRTLEVYTDEPGLQFYGGNFMDGSDTGIAGKAYEFRTSFALETQHFPDSPNQPDFPSTLLEPGQQYTSTCVYKFGVAEGQE